MAVALLDTILVVGYILCKGPRIYDVEDAPVIVPPLVIVYSFPVLVLI